MILLRARDERPISPGSSLRFWAGLNLHVLPAVADSRPPDVRSWVGGASHRLQGATVADGLEQRLDFRAGGDVGGGAGDRTGPGAGSTNMPAAAEITKYWNELVPDVDAWLNLGKCG